MATDLAWEATIGALQAVEDWWLTQADQSNGAPACIFMVREVLAAHKRDTPCPDCGGTGWTFGHADDCYDELCALNGDMHSCVGKLERCHCAAPFDGQGSSAGRGNG